MQSRIKHLLKHFALVLKAKLNQLKPFVRFVFHPSTLLSSPTYRIIKGLRIQTLFILLYASFSCPYNESGFLTIGFSGRQPNIADWYTNNGSLYMTSLAFLPLGLPATHPFWTDAELPWTSKKAWSGQPFPKDHHWGDGAKIRDLW